MAKSVQVGPSMPPEASQKGGLNDTISDEERKPKTAEKLDKGPAIAQGETGQVTYGKSSYKLPSGLTRHDN